MVTKRDGIFVPTQVGRRVKDHKIIPEEPAWKVIERLLDSYDLSHPKVPPEPREALPA